MSHDSQTTPRDQSRSYLQAMLNAWGDPKEGLTLDAHAWNLARHHIESILSETAPINAATQASGSPEHILDSANPAVAAPSVTELSRKILPQVTIGQAIEDESNACTFRHVCRLMKRKLEAAQSATQPTAEDSYKILYMELLYAVARKWPGETRHQTALKYIQQAERCDLTADSKSAAVGGKSDG